MTKKKQRDAVNEKVANVGSACCSICDVMRADCIQFKTGAFPFRKTVNICDSCGAFMLFAFSSKIGGDAH